MLHKLNQRNFLKLVFILQCHFLSPFAFSTDRGDDFKEWLGNPIHTTTKTIAVQEMQDFIFLGIMSAHDFLQKKTDGWNSVKIHAYDPYGNRVNPSFQRLNYNQFGTDIRRTLSNGYYFVERKVDDQLVRAVIGVGKGSDCATSMSIYFADEQSEHGKKLESELELYKNVKNPYKNSVIHSVKDQYGNVCFNFLENVGDYKSEWDDLILEEAVKTNLYKNTFKLIETFPYYLSKSQRVHRGALLYGPPGTGKSFLGQVLISQILHGKLKGKSSMVVVTARHLSASYLVAQLFRVAQLVGPTTIFMEDIDLLGIKSRNESSLDGDSRDKEILNEFLNGMDGLVDVNSCLFIGTTNQVGQVDEALSRSGRLGLHYYFALPTHFERRLFFERFLKKKAQVDEDVAIEWLAGMTEKFSGADIITAIELTREQAYIEGSWVLDEQGSPTTILLLKKEHFESSISRVKNNDVKTYGESITP